MRDVLKVNSVRCYAWNMWTPITTNELLNWEQVPMRVPGAMLNQF